MATWENVDQISSKFNTYNFVFRICFDNLKFKISP